MSSGNDIDTIDTSVAPPAGGSKRPISARAVTIAYVPRGCYPKISFDGLKYLRTKRGDRFVSGAEEGMFACWLTWTPTTNATQPGGRPDADTLELFLELVNGGDAVSYETTPDVVYP